MGDLVAIHMVSSNILARGVSYDDNNVAVAVAMLSPLFSFPFNKGVGL